MSEENENQDPVDKASLQGVRHDPAESALEDYFIFVEEEDGEADATESVDPDQESISDSCPGPFSRSPYDHLDVALDVRFEYASVPQAEDPVVNALVQISPEGMGLMDRVAGPVCHVILALDLSASMDHDDKFPVLMDAVRTMLFDLQDPDSADVMLSFVVFGMGAAVLLRDVPARHLDPRDFVKTVFESDLLFSRYTDIGGALRHAAVLAGESHKADKRLPQRVMLLTDGKPQDVPCARSAMETLRRMPVDVDCLAFGDDADVTAMKRLMSGGRGGTVKQVMRNTIGTAFGRIGEVAQRIVAKRALIDLELRADVLGGAAYRYRPGRHSYGPRAFNMGRHFHTDLGTLETERVYQLLFQLRLPESSRSETEIGRLTLRVPGIGGACTFESLLSLPRHAGSEFPEPDEQVRKAMEILAAEDHDDAEAQLRALKTRRQLLVSERRDARVIRVLDKAIQLLEETGNLEGLTPGERAAMSAHTRTVSLSRRARTGRS